MKKSRNAPRQPSMLTREQLAVGEVMAAAIGEYSESNWCASWRSGIEHDLWDEVSLRKEDAYEAACARLRKLAGASVWRRPRKRSRFTEGLKLLSEQYGIWVCYQAKNGRTVLPIEHWLSRHSEWVRERIANRVPYERVWEFAHWKGFKKPKRVPPMPKIKLPLTQTSG